MKGAIYTFEKKYIMKTPYNKVMYIEFILLGF
jgi:hypothetical protein